MRETFLDIYPDYDKMFSDGNGFFSEIVYNPASKDYEVAEIFGKDKATDQIWINFYHALAGRHGADEVLYDENLTSGQFTGLDRWKLKFFAIINNHGEEFMQKIKLQSRIRAMTDKDLMDSGLDVNSVAYNPASVPSANFSDTDIGKVETINTQTARGGRRSLADAIMLRERLLSFDYWEDFLRLFDPLFKKILSTPWEEDEITEVDP